MSWLALEAPSVADLPPGGLKVLGAGLVLVLTLVAIGRWVSRR